MKIVFLVSGGGGHLKYLYESTKLLKLPINIVGVIADRDCGALNFGRENNIYAIKVEYSKTNPFQLREELTVLNADLIITNIHKIIDAETLLLFPHKFINLHYSLLPAFAGLIGIKTIEEAKKLNVGFIGATCHYITEVVDSGEVISQASFAANWSKPLEELMEVTFRSACLILLDSVIKALRIKVEEKPVPNLIIKKTNVLFNPPLSFDAGNVFNSLWPNNS